MQSHKKNFLSTSAMLIYEDSWASLASNFHILCFHSCQTFLTVSLCTCRTVYLSLAERRSVVIGSCWMVWCSIRANRPARLVMAIRRFLSCSNSSSSLYHWQTDKQTDYSLGCSRRSGMTDKVLLPHHSDPLQVDLGAAQLLPAVVLVALSLGDTAELTRWLKHVLDQRAATHLVSRDLSRRSGGQRYFTIMFFFFNCTVKLEKRRAQWAGSVQWGWGPTFGSLECSGHRTCSRLQ